MKTQRTVLNLTEVEVNVMRFRNENGPWMALGKRRKGSEVVNLGS